MNGFISISRVCGGGSGATIAISIEDKTSGIEFCRVEMSPEDFGNAVTGLASQDCKIETRALQFVGMKRERKVETVTTIWSEWEPTKREEALRESCKHLEVDGWMCSPYSAVNSRGRAKPVGGMFSGLYECQVDFIRYVPVEKESESE